MLYYLKHITLPFKNVRLKRNNHKKILKTIIIFFNIFSAPHYKMADIMYSKTKASKTNESGSERSMTYNTQEKTSSSSCGQICPKTSGHIT